MQGICSDMHDLSSVFVDVGDAERPRKPVGSPAEIAHLAMTYPQSGDWYQVRYPRSQGWVREISLWQGAMLTLCDMSVMRAHQGQHVFRDGVYLCLVLEGTLALAGHDGRWVDIAAGEGGVFRAVNAHGTSPHLLKSWHAVGRLRCISLLIEEERQQPENVRKRLGIWDTQTTSHPPYASDGPVSHISSSYAHPSRWMPGFSLYQQLEASMPAAESEVAMCEEGCLLHWQGIGLQLLSKALQTARYGTRSKASISHGRPVSESAGDAVISAAAIHASPCRHLEAVRKRLNTSPQVVHPLSELARLACMSPSSLRQKFRVAYGKSLGHYQRECRMQCAQQALLQGMSIQQVAHRVGYAHACNFATAYRRHFGLSPQEARARFHETG